MMIQNMHKKAHAMQMTQKVHATQVTKANHTHARFHAHTHKMRRPLYSVVIWDALLKVY